MRQSETGLGGATLAQRGQLQQLERIEDLDGFQLSPLLLLLHERGVSTRKVGLLSLMITAGALFGSASLSGSGLGPVHAGRSTVADFLSALRSPAPHTLGTVSVPLLRDYPSLAAAFSIACSPWIVYSIFTALRTLHSSLAANDCLRIASPGALATLDEDLRALNQRLRRQRRPARLLPVLALCLAPFVLASVIGMRHGGFGYLLNRDGPGATAARLYQNWWARWPRPGFFVWCLFGAFGLYMTYVECTVGIFYARFLRQHKSLWQFLANPHNVDDHYGWAPLRTVFSFIIGGVATSSISLLPVYLYFRHLLPVPVVVLVIVSYILIIVYTLIGPAVYFRGHVLAAKLAARQELSSRLKELRGREDLSSLMRQQLLTDELRYYESIPNFPVFSRWSMLAVAVAAIGIFASLSQVYSVLR